jgi:hypothetical protein
VEAVSLGYRDSKNISFIEVCNATQSIGSIVTGFKALLIKPKPYGVVKRSKDCAIIITKASLFTFLQISLFDTLTDPSSFRLDDTSGK